MTRAEVLAANVSDVKFWCVRQGVLVIFFLLQLEQLCAVNICDRERSHSDPYKCQRKTCKCDTVEEALDAKVLFWEGWS